MRQRHRPRIKGWLEWGAGVLIGPLVVFPWLMLLVAWRMGVDFHSDLALAVPASVLWLLLVWGVHRF